MIQVTCPSCDVSLQIVSKYAGKTVRCPECRKAMRVLFKTAPAAKRRRRRPRRQPDDERVAMHLRVAHPVGQETPADTLEMLAHEARAARQRHHHAH
ncbi:MAG: hypothetical protein GVY16_06925 [Planctomycetes bacterium]|nr:hypothetical protein [Phycisphaerae bacterium]NBB95459.1 hypothetical protein [Planctomycetota bacterium]